MSDPFLGMPRPELVDDARCRVGNASRGGLVCQDLIVLDSRRARVRQAFARRLPEGAALLLSPADAVHSFGARGGLRVHFLDASWTILESDFLPQRRAKPCPPGTAAALLLPGDAPAQPIGDQLELLGAQPRLPDRFNAE